MFISSKTAVSLLMFSKKQNISPRMRLDASCEKRGREKVEGGRKGMRGERKQEGEERGERIGGRREKGGAGR